MLTLFSSICLSVWDVGVVKMYAVQKMHPYLGTKPSLYYREELPRQVSDAFG
jgi:hypothetical protein